MLVDLREKYVGQSFEIVGIAVDNAAKVREFSANYKISYPVLIAEVGGVELIRKLGNSAGALPFTVILDRRGAIVNRKLGILHRNDIEPKIKDLINN